MEASVSQPACPFTPCMRRCVPLSVNTHGCSSDRIISFSLGTEELCPDSSLWLASGQKKLTFYLFWPHFHHLLFKKISIFKWDLFFFFLVSEGKPGWVSSVNGWCDLEPQVGEIWLWEQHWFCQPVSKDYCSTYRKGVTFIGLTFW